MAMPISTIEDNFLHNKIKPHRKPKYSANSAAINASGDFPKFRH